MLATKWVVTILSFLISKPLFLPSAAKASAAFSQNLVASTMTVRRQTRLAAKSIKPDKIKSIATSTSSTSSPTKKKAARGRSSFNQDEISSELWKDWVQHADASFHHFSAAESTEIRLGLLLWYRANRRKLPWRGDPPPYDGSTAGINSQATPSSQKQKKVDAKQPSITSFFQQPRQQSKSKLEVQPDNNKSSLSSASIGSAVGEKIPVSGYGVWVSEIMLQQTRVEAVIPYWIKWMESFPTVHDLAQATEDEVNAHWAGLGFYRRARLLHQGAKHVVDKYDGKLPQTTTELLQITGIGPYTASAIASIAYDVCVPVVDGNVCRVLSRLKGIANHIKAPILKDKLGWDLAKQIVEAGDGQHAGEVNQALMELGATYCAPSGTGLDDRDPLKGFYLSTKLSRSFHESLNDGATKALKPSCSCELCGSTGIDQVMEKFQATITKDMTADEAAAVGHATFPLDPPKGKKREEDLAVVAIANTCKDSGETWWLLAKRPPEGLLAGQWEFPSVLVATRNATKTAKPPSAPKRRKAIDAYLKELFEEDIGQIVPAATTTAKARTMVQPAPIEHIFSHVKHYMWVETCETSVDLKLLEWITHSKKEVRWMREQDMKQVGITSGVKKVLKAVKIQTGVATSKKRKR